MIIKIFVFYSFKYWLIYFPRSSVGKESACKAGDLGLIPGLGRSPGEGKNTGILAWRIPWTEESGRLQSMGSQELDTT